jgi:hypothetical protein
MKDDSGSNITADDVSQGSTRLAAKKGEFVEVKGRSFTKA